MTKTFERFLQALSDEELRGFARERARHRAPYWRAIQTAARIELSRRGLAAEEPRPPP